MQGLHLNKLIQKAFQATTFMKNSEKARSDLSQQMLTDKGPAVLTKPGPPAQGPGWEGIYFLF